jgi:hypothetical protein
MGKTKKRNIALARNQKDQLNISRKDAITQVSTALMNNDCNEDIKNLISLFGITAEELTEQDISYETMKCLNLVNGLL